MESATLSNITDLIVRPLEVSDAGVVAAMLLAERPEYARFFYAFAFNEAEIAEILASRTKDVYSGIFWQSQLVAIFMLRGWDEDYEVPSFGVFVVEKHRGGSFMRISLDVAKMISKLMGAKRLRATIHPDNVSAKGAGRLGFVQSGGTTIAGNIIYHMDL